MIAVPLLIVIGVVAGGVAVVRLALRGDDREGSSFPGLALGVAGGAVVLLLLMTIGLSLARGTVGAGDDAGDDDAAPLVSRPPVTKADAGDVAADIELRATPDVSLDVPPTLGDVAPGDVIVVRGTGFPPNTTGTIGACTPGCGDPFPVRFDDDGNAVTQYQLDAVATATCASRDDCFLEMRSVDVRASSHLLLGSAPTPPPVVSVTPGGGVHAGDTVLVSVLGATTASTASTGSLDALACPALATNASECSASVPVGRPLAIGRDTAKIVVVDPVAGAAVAAAVPVSLVARPGPHYAVARVAAGLAIALALAAIATWLARATDWHPEPEAAVPAFDAVDL